MDSLGLTTSGLGSEVLGFGLQASGFGKEREETWYELV
jgi:hypothetical protein